MEIHHHCLRCSQVLEAQRGKWPSRHWQNSIGRGVCNGVRSLSRQLVGRQCSVVQRSAGSAGSAGKQAGQRLVRSVRQAFCNSINMDYLLCFAFLFVVSISCISEVDLCLFSILFLTEEYLTGQRFIHCRLWIESKRSCSSFTTTTTNVESNAVSMSSHPISSEKRKGHKSIVLVTSGIIMYMGRVFSSFIVISQS